MSFGLELVPCVYKFVLHSLGPKILHPNGVRKDQIVHTYFPQNQRSSHNLDTLRLMRHCLDPRDRSRVSLPRTLIKVGINLDVHIDEFHHVHIVIHHH